MIIIIIVQFSNNFFLLSCAFSLNPLKWFVQPTMRLDNNAHNKAYNEFNEIVNIIFLYR